jgi:hypothetical protein
MNWWEWVRPVTMLPSHLISRQCSSQSTSFKFSVVTEIAINEQKKLERELALSLWAYTNGNETALRYLAENHKYVLGYYYFHKSVKDQAAPVIYATKAEDAFTEAIGRRNFVAPSKYMLTVMMRMGR